jgi:hypothetical protein
MVLSFRKRDRVDGMVLITWDGDAPPDEIDIADVHC